ncbi:MAG: hypothetical protein K2Q26_00535 [Bdellovibrionales bacterium]|nr:hypothetical protein [Bdellovibrionales bacterium]
MFPMFLKRRQNLIIVGIILVLMIIYFLQRKSEEPISEQALTVEEQVVPETQGQPLGLKPKVVESPSASSPVGIVKTEEPEPEDVKRARTLAKMTLSSMYTAQKAYHSEFGRYTTDLKMAGWMPAEKEIVYKAGFVKAYWADPESEFEIDEEDPRFMDSDTFAGFTVPSEVPNEPPSFYSVSEKVKSSRLGDYQQHCKNGCTAGPDHFEILLVMPLQDEKHVDVWLINNKKELVLVQDGRKNPTP